MTMKKILILSLLIVFAVTGAASADPALDKIKAAGKLLVATRDSKWGFCIKNDKGEIVGLDIDLANAIGEKLGVPVELVVGNWDLIKTAWEGDGFSKFDIAISTITITDERASKVDFSEWYFTSGGQMAVKADAPYQKPDELAEKRIAVIDGTIHNTAVASKYPKATLVLVKSYEELAQSLSTDKADAFVTDMIQLRLMAEKDSSFKVLEDLLTRERFGVAMPKGSTDLKAVVDEIVNAKKKELYDKWFGK